MDQSPELLRRLLRAKDRMDGACHEPWPVARLARVSAVSPAHFARAFKAAFGVPPHRYLLSRRIERAVSLLRDRIGATGVLFAGDDVTDEDALRSLRPGDVGVRVGDGDTAATIRVSGIAELARLLAEMAHRRLSERQ